MFVGEEQKSATPSLEGEFSPYPFEAQSQVTVLLANSLGNYAQLYTRQDMRGQHTYLKSLGYAGHIAQRAVNALHDTGLKPSNLYEDDGLHGYVVARQVKPYKVVPWATAQPIYDPYIIHPRVIAVTIFDFDTFREHAAEGVEPFNTPSRRAAAELMLRLANQPPLDLGL